MQRYFLELSYKGTAYSGFQIQQTGVTIQSEVTDALSTICRTAFQLTGSSRTDAGVHAEQNYFHFDTDLELTDKHVYNLNAVLPSDIAVKQIRRVGPTAHCRFDAISRSYRYQIYRYKDPFLTDTAWLYPFTIDRALLDQAAAILMRYTDFTSFSKRNTQVKTFNCSLELSQWVERDGLLLYEVRSNRFLRGMIRGLVATMLRVARGSISINDFRNIIESKDCAGADFSAPAQGLCLTNVAFPASFFL
ncbi:MAG: tRNA pseudouridine(38-40) synthase TruA [Bacteroidetes bacterium]|nr:tRNA pseudouridine(38-40) synthase TruA [Bacteroidota bacterium]